MTRNEREQERELLADLEARTGRDLATWMALISAKGFADKNETIDWLRGEGLPFARASWLERIHSNGGRPIYGEPPPASTSRAKPPPPPKPPTAREVAELEKLLSAGKGYRPLYHLLESEIRSALPALSVSAKQGYLSLGCPREFAAVTLSASELRLGLDLGEQAFDAYVQKARMRGPGPAISHMLVLIDARQVNADLLNLIKAANQRVNG
jgi:hypothetical protein